MNLEYKHNHYVPEWYQRRFLLRDKTRCYYLDLRPETITNNGHTYTRRNLMQWGPAKCFAQDDLYTTKWGNLENRDIEKFFFGPLDEKGQKAVELFSRFKFTEEINDAWQMLILYMSVQKLRTPKGLGWLQQIIKSRNGNETLIKLQKLQGMFCSIWGEAVWQIADAHLSPTKFIISDHPVVAYNRECFPGSKWCMGVNDPDIRYAATHTFFPLSSEKILILTNLNWVRDPFQNPRKLRPNPNFFRPGGFFSLLDIQHERHLTEEEVLEINYITKKRAFRYIAAAKKEWLYPEKYLRSMNWRKLGDGYLLMPDPRHIHGGGETFVSFKDGRSAAWNEYGHKPWQDGYEDKKRQKHEWATMLKFKSEWTATYGPEYRGVLYKGESENNTVRRNMENDWYQEECKRDREYLKQYGEKTRRRQLKR
mgnify:CR=1 FL=1